MFIIVDLIHCDYLSRHRTYALALGKLKKLAKIPWDSYPNKAPCTQWRKCGREYFIREFDIDESPWKFISQSESLLFKNISLLENNKVEIGKKRSEQLARALNVHPAIIMFPEYEAELIQKVA
jgi:hypothetical protein